MNELDAIKNAIIKFYNDPLYQELKAYYGKTTLFNILKIERNENRHSAFLAWLLDVNGSHGLGEEPLKRFMRLLAKMDDKYNEPFLVGNYQVENVEVVTEKPAKVEGQKKTGRVDIFVSFDYKLLNVKVEEKDTQYHVHVIVENKVYTNEHDDQTKLYLDWARQTYKGKHNQTIIGVFLAPEKPENCSGDEENGFKYVKITYQDILQDLIEPLLKMEMSPEAHIFITDYIINLGQPVQDKGEDEKSNNQDTILAVSNENEKKFAELYKENQVLLDAALYAKCYERNSKQLQTVFHDLERFNEYSKETLLMLETFWDSNSDLLRMTLNTVLKDGVEEDNSEVLGSINVLLRLNESNRDNTKYLVYAADGTLMNENNKPSPKSLSSFYIFKAWVHDHPNAALNDIREAFSIEKCAQSKSDTFQYLFYRKSDIEYALENNKAEGRTYYNAPLDETKDATIKENKYLTWDFFIDENKHCLDKRCLEIQGEKVLSMKMWLKNEFDRLIDYAKDRFGILVKEQ
jgi:hypothetical protein